MHREQRRLKVLILVHNVKIYRFRTVLMWWFPWLWKGLSSHKRIWPYRSSFHGWRLAREHQNLAIPEREGIITLDCVLLRTRERRGGRSRRWRCALNVIMTKTKPLCISLDRASQKESRLDGCSRRRYEFHRPVNRITFSLLLELIDPVERNRCVFSCALKSIGWVTPLDPFFMCHERL